MGIVVVKIFAGAKRFGLVGRHYRKGEIQVNRKRDASRAVITTMWPPQTLQYFIQTHYIKEIRSIINVTFQNGSYRN